MQFIPAEIFSSLQWLPFHTNFTIISGQHFLHVCWRFVTLLLEIVSFQFYGLFVEWTRQHLFDRSCNWVTEGIAYHFGLIIKLQIFHTHTKRTHLLHFECNKISLSLKNSKSNKSSWWQIVWISALSFMLFEALCW